MPPVNRNQPKRAASSESQYSLMEFLARFPDDDACITFLWRTRFSEDGEHAECPKCETVRVFKRYGMSSRGTAWTCTACGHHIHPLAGTIFRKSSTSLHLWFYAMYIMASTRCGISAKQLERELGVTYKCAWRIFHLIRNQLMEQDTEPMSGEVEMDETFVGGGLRAKDRASYAHLTDRYEKMKAARLRVNAKKTPVFGMVQRGGKVSAYVVPSVQGRTLGRHVEARVLPASTIYTDEAPSYVGIARKGGYEHKRIAHEQKVYVEGDTHTNTIEGFWSLVKRGISGTHHAVSAKHLQGYLNEYAWRYNMRDDPRSMFELLLARAALPL